MPGRGSRFPHRIAMDGSASITKNPACAGFFVAIAETASRRTIERRTGRHIDAGLHDRRSARRMCGRDALRRGCAIASTRMSVARRTCAERVFSAQRAWKMSWRMQPQHFGLEQRHGTLLGVDTTGERRAGLRNGRWFRCCAFAPPPVLAGVWLRARDVRVRGRGARRHIRVPGDRDPYAPLRLRRGHPRSLRLPADRTSSVLRNRLADCDRKVCGLRRAMRPASRGDPPEPLVSQAFRPSRHGGKYRRKASHGLRWRGSRRRTLRA